MSWHDLNDPQAMNRLPPPVRDKAVEIASALVREGCNEVTAIRIAITKAREWAVHHGWDPDRLE